MKTALAIATLASCLTLTTAARAQGAPPVPQGLLACEKIQDTAERVRCYDEQVAAMKRAASGAAPASAAATAPAAASTPSGGAEGAPAAAPRAAPAASSIPAAPPAPALPARSDREAQPEASEAGSAAPSTARSFGQEELPQSQRPKTSRKNETLESSITGVSKDSRGIYMFSLANGQIWREEGSEVALFVRTGDPVRIKRASLGSYHMWTPGVGAKNWMYVRRIQ